MNPTRQFRTRWLVTSLALATAAYAVHVGVTWLRYGQPRASDEHDKDRLLERFMPEYDVVERHHIRVAAPAALTLEAAAELNLQDSPIVRTIVKAREIILGSTARKRPHPRGLVAEARALGWGVLANLAGRELVMGAAARPWEPDVTFRALPPGEFAGFSEPGYVKIAWTIRVDPISAAESVFRSETRAIATDAYARRKFRRYWAFFSPGITLIRWAVLRPVKREAERRAARLIDACRSPDRFGTT